MGEPVVLDTAWIFEGEDGPRIERIRKDSQQMGTQGFGGGGIAASGANDQTGEVGLEQPPLDMAQLAGLMGGPTAQGNSIHARCVKQKATDTLGRGLTLRSKDEAEGARGEDAWGAFVEMVEANGDGSLKERLTNAHQDFESVGWAVLEVGRAKDGTLDGLWHVPAHTVRAHKDGVRYAQERDGKYRWFKRFGNDGDVDSKRGGWSPAPLDATLRGNEFIVIKNYTPASSYYGLPDHVPALQALAGWSAQAEFNIRFFGNQAVPSYAVIVEGADLTPKLEGLILDHFRRIKGDPARTIVIPVPATPGVGETFQPKVRFERLSVEVKEASFRMYRMDAALEICISHGVPPYRIGWPIMGSLGGSTAEEMTHIYNDSIVQPRQETWEQRLNATLLGGKGLAINRTHALKANELDVRNEQRDIERSKALYELGVVTPNDIARYFGMGERPDGVLGGDDYIAIPLNPQGGTATEFAMRSPAAAYIEEVAELTALRKRVVEALPEAA